MWWRKHKNTILITLNVLIAFGLFGSFLASSTGQARVGAEQPTVLGSASITTAQYDNKNLQETAESINSIRTQAGLSSLARSPELDAIAAQRAIDMQKNTYYAHKGSDGRYFNDLMDEQQVDYGFSCENLNINDDYDSGYFIRSWLASTAGHKECMLRSSHTKAGYAVTELKSVSGVALNQTVVVAIYSN